MGKLDGRVVFITGAARGQGRFGINVTGITLSVDAGYTIK